jgi:transcriptional regulator with XRE-family HTH domain
MNAEDIKKWRASAGMTQQKLAEFAGVTANTVARWERGEVVPPAMLSKLYECLNLMLGAHQELKHLKRAHERLMKRRGVFADEETLLRMRDALFSDKPTLPPERLRQLLQLCHPDKHGSSRASVAATQWLLSLRK